MTDCLTGKFVAWQRMDQRGDYLVSGELTGRVSALIYIFAPDKLPDSPRAYELVMLPSVWDKLIFFDDRENLEKYLRLATSEPGKEKVVSLRGVSPDVS